MPTPAQMVKTNIETTDSADRCAKVAKENGDAAMAATLQRIADGAADNAVAWCAAAEGGAR